VSTHDGIYDRLLRSSAASEIFGEERQLQSMLDFEAALCQVEAELGLIPTSAVDPIRSCCAATTFDRDVLMDGIARSGNLAIPMVNLLTKAVQRISPDASGYVHWGATSQDAIDTGLMLQLRDLLRVCDEQVAVLCQRLVSLVSEHRQTIMPGRTWLQHAVPITFGLKAAGWLDAMLRSQERLAQLAPRVLVLQFGGAAGTLASLGARGAEVTAALARELRLGVADVPWHSNRDRLAEVATFLGVLMGTTGKIARDLSLMGQTELGEVAEASTPGRGGSSTMPHKRNPVLAASVLSSAIRIPGLVGTMLSAMDQEHERGLGGWHAEWETLPEICTLTLGAVESLSEMLAGLDIFPHIMRQNLERTNGLLLAEAVSMALAKKIGKAQAHSLVQDIVHKAVEAGVSLESLVETDERVVSHFKGEEVRRLFRPEESLGDSQRMIDDVLARHERSKMSINKGHV
jgi:3-carboxy-cis,cis-muconate cycloisomerase